MIYYRVDDEALGLARKRAGRDAHGDAVVNVALIDPRGTGVPSRDTTSMMRGPRQCNKGDHHETRDHDEPANDSNHSNALICTRRLHQRPCDRSFHRIHQDILRANAERRGPDVKPGPGSARLWRERLRKQRLPILRPTAIAHRHRHTSGPGSATLRVLRASSAIVGTKSANRRQGTANAHASARRGGSEVQLAAPTTALATRAIWSRMPSVSGVFCDRNERVR